MKLTVIKYSYSLHMNKFTTLKMMIFLNASFHNYCKFYNVIMYRVEILGMVFLW